MITDTDKRLALDLHLWIMGCHDHFTVQLFSLIAKADKWNQARIALAYPDHIRLFREWRDSTPESAFWEKYGVNISTE